jgi:hypothetical protein
MEKVDRILKDLGSVFVFGMGVLIARYWADYPAINLVLAYAIGIAVTSVIWLIIGA